MENLSHKKYLVFGAGVSGQSAFALLNKLGLKSSLIEGDGPEDIDAYDEMILSPGIPRTHKLVKKFLDEGKEVIGEIEFASRYIQTPIIAITGSNGKTTTCMMVSEFLVSLGKKVFLGGNIGTPLSELAMRELDGQSFDYAVCEVSSFQLESLTSFSPKVAAILNLSFTHQERYSSFDEYIQAKAYIFDYQKEGQVSLFPNDSSLERFIKPSFSLKKLWKIFSELDYSKMKIVGEHNKENFQHCFQIVESLGIDFSVEDANNFMSEFKGAHFRVEEVANINGILFYNDSKSTNLKSTTSAIECFENKNVIVICGGKKRDHDLESFRILLGYSELVDIYSFGESGEDLKKILGSKFEKTLEEVMLSIKDNLKKYPKPLYILFSPGFPSFDLYRNYIERGEDFNKLVSEFN